MIFVNLIYGHFDILMSQYAQMNKSHAIQGYAKVVFWLHTAKTENPDSPQTYPSTSGCSEYHSYTPKHPTNTPQTPPSESSEHKIPTDDNRHRQTNSNGTGRCPRVSGGVCWHLLSSNGILSSLEMSGGIPGICHFFTLYVLLCVKLHSACKITHCV